MYIPGHPVENCLCLKDYINVGSPLGCSDPLLPPPPIFNETPPMIFSLHLVSDLPVLGTLPKKTNLLQT